MQQIKPWKSKCNVEKLNATLEICFLSGVAFFIQKLYNNFIRHGLISKILGTTKLG
jgi:hypothetical protein